MSGQVALVLSVIRHLQFRTYRCFSRLRCIGPMIGQRHAFNSHEYRMCNHHSSCARTFSSHFAKSDIDVPSDPNRCIDGREVPAGKR